MTESIVVGYKPILSPNGSVLAYHKYILYTNSQGMQFYTRGGPGYQGPGAGQGGAEEASFSPVWGNVKTETGEYIEGTPDWDEGGSSNPDPLSTDTPDSRESIKTGDDLSSDWQKIKDAMRDIDLEDHPYFPADNNSNTAADEALKRAGLPQPLNDGIDGNLSPGSGNDFPDTSHLPEWLKKHPDPNKPIPDDANRNGIPDTYERIDPGAKASNDAAKKVLPPRRDPLTFDLDGDGLETTGIAATNPIFFDHDGDGIKNGTGWVSSDDAFLVLDKNGNGSIDSGRELFGDSTIKSNGQTATDGFDALADLDNNADGNISSADAQFASLRLWRDFNQDGISQSNELFTLVSQNISSIKVASVAHSQTLPNGNQIADLGAYTKTNGTVGQAGTVTGNLADVNLGADTFHRSFTDVLDTTSVATLPDMQGSGKVRDLREAATQSTTLQALLTQYSAATTFASQTALLDQLLDAWADTGGLAEGLTQRVAAMTGYTKADNTVIPYTLQYNAFGTVTNSNGTNYTPEFAAKIAEWEQKLHIVEAFNGSYFYGLPGTTQTTGAVSGLAITTPNENSTNVQISVSFAPQQLDLLQQSYDAIKSSVYRALLIQTRFKPLLDQISLVIDSSGINLDFTQINAYFDNALSLNAIQGAIDLVEFNIATNNMLSGTGWQGWARLLTILDTTTPTQELLDVIKFNNLSINGLNGSSGTGTTGNDVVLGRNQNDTLIALAGDDAIYGGNGNDYIDGGNGNDTLEGGAGNDILYGGDGIDTYIINQGDGQDIISVGSSTNAEVLQDTVVLGVGIRPVDVSLSRIVPGSNYTNGLVLSIAGTTDVINISGYFYTNFDPSNPNHRVNNTHIKFADGTIWSYDNVLDLLAATDSRDILEGHSTADIMHGMSGDDTIYGQAGNDVLFGDLGNDELIGGLGDDTLDGGIHNDQLTGGSGIDTYKFGYGSGQDRIYWDTANKNDADVIEVGAGITAADLQLFVTGTHLTIIIKNTPDMLRLDSYFENYPTVGPSGNNSVIKFADGLIWSYTDVINHLDYSPILSADTFWSPNPYIETVSGGSGNDYIFGSNSDQLYGNEGDDTLVGGSGTDILDGGIGSDTYVYGRGSGLDTINDSAEVGKINKIYMAVMPQEVKASSFNRYDLSLSITGTDDMLIVKWYFDVVTNDPVGVVDEIHFRDGTIWTAQIVKNLVLQGTDAAEALWGYSSDDSMDGKGGDDYINGFGGNDNLIGGTGIDTLEGGIGNDTYDVDNLSDVINEYSSTDGTDLVLSSVSWTLGTFLENLTLTGNAAIDGTGNTLANIIIGNGASNTLTGGSGNDTLDGGLGVDSLVGGTGNDTYIVDNAGDIVTEAASAGTDIIQSSVTYTLSTNVENLTLTGTANIDGTGNTTNNVLTGNSGNNLLDGGTGNDTMLGGAGNDVYFVNVATDVVTELANEGNDTVNSAVTYTIASLANIENITLTGSTAINATGNASDNVLIGNTGNNSITGGAGNDTLEGGLGVDTLVGGLGNDTYNYYVGYGNDQIDNTATDNATAIDTLYLKDILPASVVLSRVVNDLLVTVNASDSVTVKNYFAAGDSKIDQIIFSDATVWNQADIQTRVPSVPTTGDDNLTGTSGNDTIDALAGNDTVSGGDGNDLLLGNAGNDSLNGGNGADTLNGGAGNDTMIGGLGDDVYTVDATTDVVTENLNEGTDLVNVAIATASGTYTLGANVENAILTNAVAFTLTGNALDNILTGNAVANTLNGGDGNDTLNGLAGNDTMVGGLGNDTYTIDVTTDVVTEAASAGTDLVNVAVATAGGTYTVATNVENATLTNTVAYNLTGNASNNVLTGNAAANALNGLAGNDTMVGGLGNDTYTIDVLTDVITENLNEGTDLVNVAVATAGGTYTLAANVENATLTNTVAFTLTGNALDNTLTGNAAANTLNGGDGNDTLNGLAGNDTMIGGLGNDTYTIDVLTDVITENLNEGTDLVNVAVTTAGGTYTLAANVENATLTNTVAFMLTGNALDNVLTGNAAANTLNGGDGNDTLNGLAGNDTMVGGLGNDIYTIDVTTDVVTEAASAGTDTVNVAIATASGTYTIATNVENAILTNAVAYNLTGNALANFLRGNAANNTLTDTAGGNDLLQGLAGTDTLNDTVGNNLFDGGAGNDTITGGTGREIFIGGLGNDTITTGTGFDVISFNKGDGADIINASTGADNTISLGGNFAYSDLSLTKTGNDLILKMGATDQITFASWYLTSPTNKSVINLQVIAEAIQGFTLGGADALRNNKIENFNFTNLVAAFDAAGATANWQLTDAILTTHLLAGSDTAAIGGDLAYQYGKNSNLTGMGSLNAQSVIAAASFGQTAQTLNNPTVWQAELVKLG